MLLTHSNFKANKSKDFGYATAFLHLAPSNLSGVINVCPMASAGCRAACLNVSGHGKSNRVQNARIRKTREFSANPLGFVNALAFEISVFKDKAVKSGLKPCIRLNATSDISWEDYKTYNNTTLFEEFPDVQFYDYTKRINRLGLNIPNYHLTFSLSENNELHAAIAHNKYKKNIAAVFNSKILPNQFPIMGKDISVVDGDIHDLRFLDTPNTIVGLRAKNKARKDTTGFAISLN